MLVAQLQRDLGLVLDVVVRESPERHMGMFVDPPDGTNRPCAHGSKDRQRNEPRGRTILPCGPVTLTPTAAPGMDSAAVKGGSLKDSL
jgi:hypothetical protein